VITGYNTDIKHKDRVFHVQTEDKGLDNPSIESLIYMGGKIIASRQYSYASLLETGYDEKTIQELLDSQHRKMMRDIRGGKYDPEGPPPFGDGIITDRGFDTVVLEFIQSQTGSESLDLVVKGGGTARAGDLIVLELEVLGSVRRAPVEGAEVAIQGIPRGGGHEVSLFKGATDRTGCVRAGVEIPRELGGGVMAIVASSPVGSDEIRMEIQET